MCKNKKFLLLSLVFFLALCPAIPVAQAGIPLSASDCTAQGGTCAGAPNCNGLSTATGAPAMALGYCDAARTNNCCQAGPTVGNSSAVSACTAAPKNGSCKDAVIGCPSGTRQDGSCGIVSGAENICCVASTSSQSATPQSGGFQYQLLEKIPGAEGTGSDLKGYLENIYKVALVLVTLSAVFMLSVGGFMYLTSAGNTSALGSAKTIIRDSLVGLILALVSYLILYVINPDLVNVTMNGLSPTPVAVQPTGTAPVGGGTAGTCGGMSPQAGINCGDASQGLADVLACMKGKGISVAVTSIGDSAGFSTCKNSWSKPPCAHAQTSCHYGGGAAKTASECQASHAADLSIKDDRGNRDMGVAAAITAAASACGGRVNDETNLPGVVPHMHVSDQTSCCSL